MSQEQLKNSLKGALDQLDQITQQINQAGKYSKDSAVYFLLRELIQEQIGTNENSSHTNNQTR